jgi:hypothetical protein
MPCNAISADAGNGSSARHRRGGPRAALSSWLKPSAAGFALLAAPAEEVDEVVLTFIGKGP